MNSSTIKEYRHFKYLFFILPGFLIWFVFALLPNLQIFWLAFYRWNGVSKVKKFVGLRNFNEFFLDPLFLKVVYNTVLYVLLLLVVQTIISLLLAVILKKNTSSNKFFRALYFSPLVLSTAIVGMTWGYMYDPNLGIINQALDAIGMKNFQQDWLGVSGLAILCVVVAHIWHNIGYPVTIILAGLQTIPDNLYEAASVEGANAVKSFFNITLPLIMPTLLRIVLLTIITGAMAFDYIYVLGGVGVANEFDTLPIYMYRAFSTNVGRPASIGVVLSLTMFLIFVAQYITTKKVEDSIN